MAKEVSPGKWVCEHPGCNYSNVKGGYVRNHEKLKHGDSGVNKGGQKKVETTKRDGVRKCPDCKGANIRLLNSNKPGEGKAKQSGLKYICEDCGEVFK